MWENTQPKAAEGSVQQEFHCWLFEPNETLVIIDKIYRFTGLNDLEDEAILYAMRNQKDGAKGVFVNGYGTYSDSAANSIIEQISVDEDDNDDWTIEN